MPFTDSCHSWCMAAMGILVTFILYSAVVFYVVIIADSIYWILVPAHRYTASRDLTVPYFIVFYCTPEAAANADSQLFYIQFFTANRFQTARVEWKQYRQCMCNVTMRHVCAPIVAVENK
jgi:hypothetical protein